jgi:hypothetical protein
VASYLLSISDSISLFHFFQFRFLLTLLLSTIRSINPGPQQDTNPEIGENLVLKVQDS